jgi:sugar phosphate isomerase/epimerase
MCSNVVFRRWHRWRELGRLGLLKIFLYDRFLRLRQNAFCEKGNDMPASPFAAQMYTLREFTKTPADIASTLKRVRKIGYESVQLSALGKIDPNELAKILKGEGLTCCATHVSPERMKSETQAVIEEHRLWDCTYTAIGGFFPKESTPQVWVDFIRDYNDIAKKFVGSGLAIGYHNHSHELVKLDGKTPMQLLLDKLDSSVWMEIDTYWITHGGGDPAAWIAKVAGRIPCAHLKDMGINNNREQYMMEVGEGNLNWPTILKACKFAGVKWYIVEQDTCYRDPFDSLETSLKNLQNMGV